MSKKEKSKAYTKWWAGVREWTTLLSAGERSALVSTVMEIDDAMKKIAKRKK